jgi:hypothetical protein
MDSLTPREIWTRDWTIRASVPGSEWSKSFIEGMLNRMGMSYFKYGALRRAYPEKVDAIASLKQRLAKYEETGNTEWLMDLANFAMIEYMHPRHPQAHYRPTDSRESPGRTGTHGGRNANPNDSIIWGA